MAGREPQPPAGSRECLVVYELMLGADVMPGSFPAVVPAGEPLRLRHVRERFPFAGRFHFRARSRDDAPARLWYDLTDEEDALPLVAADVVEVKATPMFPVETREAQARRATFPLAPAEWEEARRALGMERGEAISESTLDAIARDLHSGPATGAHEPGEAEGLSGVMKAIAGGASSFGRFLQKATARTAAMLEGVAPPSDIACANLESLRADTRTPFRAGDSAHQALLESLWSAAGQRGRFQVPSRAWVALGFASEDPRGAFQRRCGVLGLKATVFAFTRYPRNMTDLLRAPTAGAARAALQVGDELVQLTHVCADVVGLIGEEPIRARRGRYFVLFENSDAFFELVSAAMMVLSAVWQQRAAGQGVAELRDDMRRRITDWLELGPTSVDTLWDIVANTDGVRR